MIKNRFKIILCVSMIISFMAVTGSCVDHNIEEPEAIDCEGFETVSFTNQIVPLLSQKCAISGCHNGDNGAERNWTEPQKFQDHAIEARRRVQLPATDGDHMPRVGELSQEQIKLIVCWANQGASITN